MSITSQKKGEMVMVKACDFYVEQKPWGKAGYYHAIDFAGKQFRVHDNVVISHNKWGFILSIRGEIVYIDKDYVDIIVDKEFTSTIPFSNITNINH